MDASHMDDAPLYAETMQLLRAVEAHDLDSLRARMAAFAYVDVDPQGHTIVLRTEAEWEAYIRANFAMARNLGAALTHTITAYEAETAETLAYSAVRFQQHVIVDAERIVHHCVATIVWRRIANDWRQVRWQCAIERTAVVGTGDPETEEESP